MNPSKAPGPDGFTAFFYQKYWKEIGEATISNCLEILNQNRSVKEWNDTFITLIPKVKQPKKVSDFRPISLCNVAYKIVAKVIVNRMKWVLQDIISENQSAFVPGRSIFYNIIIGHECLHTIKSRRTRKKRWVALKLDMSKAYDRVEWKFLEKLMIKIGFHCQWVALIMDCITTANFSILINNSPSGKIIPQRGLRQGDPLSPYLFLLCSEALSTLLSGAAHKDIITGLKPEKFCPGISHLFFADDSLVFCRASVDQVNVLSWLIRAYEQASSKLLMWQNLQCSFLPMYTLICVQLYRDCWECKL